MPTPRHFSSNKNLFFPSSNSAFTVLKHPGDVDNQTENLLLQPETTPLNQNTPHSTNTSSFFSYIYDFITLGLCRFSLFSNFSLYPKTQTTEEKELSLPGNEPINNI